MKNIWRKMKNQYYDWRHWDYMYRHMNKQIKVNNYPEISSYTIPYINKPGINLSFDDSFRVNDWYDYGKDLFGYYDVKVTFNINAFHHYDGERELTQNEIDRLIVLQSNGHEIAHHGYRHKDVVKYSKEVGIDKWQLNEIESLFQWMEEKSHSKTGEKFKRPVTFAFPYFTSNEQAIDEVVPKYFKVVRGFHRGSNLTPFNCTGFVPSICIDSLYLKNPRNLTRILKLVKRTGLNLILTCHSILPDEVSWKKYGWPMTDHERKWRTSTKVIQYIIEKAKKLDLEFYTAAELSGVATFSDRNFENNIRNLLDKRPDEWLYISELIQINDLDLSSQQIKNLDGIQYFLNLERLDLGNNLVSDFRLLEKLPKLKELEINQKPLPLVNTI